MSALTNLLNILRTPPARFVDGEVPVGPVDGTNVSYQLVNTPNPPESLEVFYNGIVAAPTVDYTLNGKLLQFTFVPWPGPTDPNDSRTADQFRVKYRF